MIWHVISRNFWACVVVFFLSCWVKKQVNYLLFGMCGLIFRVVQKNKNGQNFQLFIWKNTEYSLLPKVRICGCGEKFLWSTLIFCHILPKNKVDFFHFSYHATSLFFIPNCLRQNNPGMKIISFLLVKNDGTSFGFEWLNISKIQSLDLSEKYEIYFYFWKANHDQPAVGDEYFVWILILNQLCWFSWCRQSSYE